MSHFLDQLSVGMAGYPPSLPYLVGVSGGRDSVALLHGLHELGYTQLAVGHVDHGLRGEESTTDAQWVALLAEKLGYPFMLDKVDVKRIAQEKKLSVETAARWARLDYWKLLCAQYDFTAVLLAHHAEDQAETVLMQALRGAGLRGLAGMRRVSQYTEVKLLRPLLAVRRAEIESYLQERGLSHREDSTNASPDMTRNRIRHEAMPLLSSIMQRVVVPQFLRLSEQLSEVDEMLHGLAKDLLEKCAAQHATLELHADLMSAHRAVQARVLHDWLTDIACVGGVDHRVIRSAVDLLHQKSPSRTNLTDGLQLRRKAKRLTITTQDAP